MVKKIKWVMIEIADNASEEHEGNCTKFYSLGDPAKVTITNTLGKTTTVTLKKEGATVTVCDDTGVATVNGD